MNKRTAKSKCLLCRENNATKENSHIIPKFLTKSILENSKGRRAYLIASDKVHLKPNFSQDTAKESFILCQGCEQYFSVLETYVSKNLHEKLWNANFAKEFSLFDNQNGIRWKVCNSLDPAIFRLFIYSIIWRCSISETEIVREFSLDSEEEERMRLSLIECRKEKENDLLSIISIMKNNISLPDFFFFTAETFTCETSNTIFIHPDAKNPYLFILNRYILVVSFKVNKAQNNFHFLNNTKLEPVKIGFFSKDYWEHLKKQQFNLMLEKSIQNLKESGEVPWLLKQNQK